MNSEYGPLANIVALAGCIIAAATAIGLAWSRGAKWQPPEEELPGATTKFSALICGVGIAILYVVGQQALGKIGLARLAGWSVGISLISLFLTIFVNTLYSYKGKAGAKVLGGFTLTPQAKNIRGKRNTKDITIQRLYETGGYDADLVWSRWSRGMIQVLSSATYLALQVFGSIGLAAAALLLSLATGGNQ